jgi:uncharacterized membrane protein YfcA
VTTFLFILVNAFAGFFQGIVGFGQGLVASPLSLALLDKKTVLTALLFTGIILNLSLFRQIKAPLRMDIFKPLLIGSIFGLPVGVLILQLLTTASLKIFVGIASLGLVLAMLFVKIKMKHMSKLTPAAGFVAGALQTSVAIPGPPVVLLLSGADVPKDEMRKILVLFFIFIGIIGIPLYIIGHIFTWQGVVFSLLSAPFIVGGGWLGNRTAKFGPHHWYRLLALITIGLSSAYAIYSGLK